MIGGNTGIEDAGIWLINPDAAVELERLGLVNPRCSNNPLLPTSVGLRLLNRLELAPDNERL